MSLTSKCKISILIATYNRCQYLENCLLSLLSLKEDDNFDYEILVINNNSTDKTKETVESYSSQFNGRLRYIFEGEQGKSHAMNRGIDESLGDILACTDDDCIIPDDWLAQIYAVVQEHDVDIIAGKVLPIFNGSLPEWLDLKQFSGPYVYHDRGDQYIENQKDKITIMGANMIMRKSAVKKYGKFKTAGRGQDVELFYNWIEAGAGFGYAPNVIVNHVTPKERLSKRYLRRWYFLAGRNFSQMFRGETTKGRTLFGVSFWVYKKLLVHSYQFIKGIVTFNPKRIVDETRIYYSWGVIFGSWGWFKAKTSENLRGD